MNNFLLFNDAIDVPNFDIFKLGISELIAIEKGATDTFFKQPNIWDINILSILYSNYGFEEQVICKFIEQMTPLTENIQNELDLDNRFSKSVLNAFLGIDFRNTIINICRQVTSQDSFLSVIRSYYAQLKCNNNEDKIKEALTNLFTDYQFTPRAYADLNYWNSQDYFLYQRALELIADIKENPFTGGKGKTEVLKNNKGVASKRLSDEHRITYTLKNDYITVLSCKGHYS